MASINPAEVSAILKQELSGAADSTKARQEGTVLEIGDGIAQLYGLSEARLGEIIRFENGTEAIALNLDESSIGVVFMGPSTDIIEGSKAYRTGRVSSIMVGEGMLGRVINTLGYPVDGKGDIKGELSEMPIERKAPGVIYRQPVNEPLQTGIKAIDSMIPIGRGQRELIIGDRQTGKSTIAIDTIINQKQYYEAGNPVYCIYVAIGQKASTVAQLYKTLEDAGAMPYTVIVAANSSDPAAMQYLAPMAGAAIGEYFRDQMHKVIEKNHPKAVNEIRGLGMINGIQLNHPSGQPVVDLCFQDNKVLINNTNGNVLRFVPPLITGKEEIDLCIKAVDDAMTKLGW